MAWVFSDGIKGGKSGGWVTIEPEIHAGTHSEEPVPLGPLEDRRSVFRLCVGRDLRYGDWRAWSLED